jgi:ribosomal protein S18 acetylase RimI-like enzyme
MIYRLYAHGDFPALYAIEEACFQPPLRFDRRYMRQLVDAAKAATWVAEEDGAMAGFAIVEWTREPGGENGGLTAYIQTIEVAPGLRGRGIGRELLRRIESSAQAAGAGAIWLHVDAANERAIALYEANGYRRGKRAEHYYGRGRPALIYSKTVQLH